MLVVFLSRCFPGVSTVCLLEMSLCIREISRSLPDMTEPRLVNLGIDHVSMVDHVHSFPAMYLFWSTSWPLSLFFCSSALLFSMFCCSPLRAR